ncbi:MAG: bifunctional 4-hydroxy-2-oxoglutarate aldolase/2-dehydro-3-deoxy-phosphogluconate aldolase [Clostridia bacterium]|nr:bifunctional 4-hydroxy-2-oxoglutarate aldolase/2-dehydro-3-deoxy-phosphogluconate aldolase [Clostridia bacterium]
MREHIINQIKVEKIIAIIRGQPPEALIPLADALVAGGIRMMEITFSLKDPSRYRVTADGIRMLNKHFSGEISVGAGTVVSREQVRMACDAGASYIVSPGCDARVIDETRKLNLVSLPGAMTPSEIAAAYEAGADFVKVFPAGVLGPSYIRAVRAPLPHIPLLAVGGVDETNAAAFIAAGVMGIGAGGKLVNAEWIAQGFFDRITCAAQAYITVVKC